MKWIVILAFVAILLALAAAGRALLKDGRDGAPKTDRMLHALAWRIGLSVALFVFILVAYRFGWIQPTGLPLSPR
nr:twin transmembrane helix small protein [Methylibium sp. T29]